MESQSPESARVRSASARVAASSCVRISARKRTTRTPDPSRSASSNTETHRNNQRSLLEGGVGSRQSPVSAFSAKGAIHRGTVFAAARSPVAHGSMIQSLLRRRHVGLLASPDLHSRLLDGAGKGKRQRPL